MSLPLRIPKVQLSILLFLIFLSTFSIYPILSNIPIFFFSLAFTIFFDLLFTFIRRKILFFPYAAIATGLIIALIIEQNATWYEIAAVSAIAMGAKNFLRISGRHIFNPASIGLSFAGIIFRMHVSWWGVSFQNIQQFSTQNLLFFLILLSPFLVSGYRMRRFYTILSFLFTYTILSLFFTFGLSVESIIQRLSDPVTIFFSIVMLPEPMTSPFNKKRQILFGSTVALITIVLSFPQLNKVFTGLLPDLFLPALLLGNLLFFKFR